MTIERYVLSIAVFAILGQAMPALADRPEPWENFGVCQGENRHQLSTYQDWLSHGYSAQWAQLDPTEVVGVWEVWPDESPNARANINVLLTNKDGELQTDTGIPVGCYGIKPGQ